MSRWIVLLGMLAAVAGGCGDDDPSGQATPVPTTVTQVDASEPPGSSDRPKLAPVSREFKEAVVAAAGRAGRHVESVRLRVGSVTFAVVVLLLDRDEPATREALQRRCPAIKAAATEVAAVPVLNVELGTEGDTLC